jgi:hypothetical protein
MFLHLSRLSFLISEKKVAEKFGGMEGVIVSLEKKKKD